MNKRSIGTNWETLVKEYLQEKKVVILEHSYRCRNGEIDLIGKDGDYLAFFEVKYRSNQEHGLAEEAVDYKKQIKICKVSDYYRYTHGISDHVDIRFDVIAINGNELQWYKNAFPYHRR